MSSVRILPDPRRRALDDSGVEAIADLGTPLGPIESVWVVRDTLDARLVSATWRHSGDAELPAGTRLRYIEFSSIYDSCFGHDWAWHFFRILDGPARGRRMVLYSGCFAPPHHLVGTADQHIPTAPKSIEAL